MKKLACAIIASALSALMVSNSAAAPPPKKATGASGEKRPTGFRGISFGASEADVRKALGLGDDSTSCLEIPTGLSCEDTFELGSVEVTAHFRFADGKFGEVLLSFSSDRYEEVRTAFVDRYGAPSLRSRTPVKTRMNVDYLDETLSWRWPGVSIVVSKYGSMVTEGVASITTDTFDAARTRQQAKARREAVAALDAPAVGGAPQPRTESVDEKLMKIDIGMSPDQVVSILGEPDSRENLKTGDSDVQDWKYSARHGMIRFSNSSFEPQHVVVVFGEGRDVLKK